jgi:hypothetical protein
VTALNPVVAVAGTIWLALGIAIYAFYRRRHGLDLVTTAKIAVPRPVTDTEAVPLGGPGIGLVARLAMPHVPRASRALRPWNSPLTAFMYIEEGLLAVYRFASAHWSTVALSRRRRSCTPNRRT